MEEFLPGLLRMMEERIGKRPTIILLVLIVLVVCIYCVKFIFNEAISPLINWANRDWSLPPISRALIDQTVTTIGGLILTLSFIIFFAGFLGFKIWKNITRAIDSKRAKLRLAKEILATETNLTRFLAERDLYDPSNVPHFHAPGWDSWDEKRKHEEFNRHTQLVLSYFSATMNLYLERFAANVIYLAEEAKRYGYEDSELESFYSHPTNTIGIGIVASRLGVIGRRIQESNGG